MDSTIDGKTDETIDGFVLGATLGNTVGAELGMVVGSFDRALLGMLLTKILGKILGLKDGAEHAGTKTSISNTSVESSHKNSPIEIVETNGLSLKSN